jgi:hypothetical protein
MPDKNHNVLPQGFRLQETYPISRSYTRYLPLRYASLTHYSATDVEFVIALILPSKSDPLSASRNEPMRSVRQEKWHMLTEMREKKS